MYHDGMRKALLLVVVASLAGCVSANKKPRSADKNGKNGAAAGGADAAPMAPGTDVQEASLKVDGVQFDADPELKTVRFEYDSATLSDDTLAVLKDNAAVLKRRKATALVAGHTDERGTVAYNLALGQKRAKEVRDYYIRLGVDGGRLATISYGKEQPSCNESNDECWQKNRRAETRVKASTAGGSAGAEQ
jgi:peptidoglycan-associated lipoprotein